MHLSGNFALTNFVDDPTVLLKDDAGESESFLPCVEAKVLQRAAVVFQLLQVCLVGLGNVFITSSVIRYITD